MDEAANVSIDSLMVPQFDTITPEEQVRVARRRMEAETRRSLIVVDGDRPVGVIEWRHIMRESEVPADAPVGDYMVREFPLLRRDMMVNEAIGHLGQVDFDRIPVVDQGGHLVGEVPRTALSKFGTTTSSAEPAVEGFPQDQRVLEQTSERFGDDTDAGPFETYEATTAGFEVQTGMAAHGSGGSKLGEIDEIILDPNGSPAAFMVKHGLLSKKHKKIPMDNVDRVEGDRVVLAIDQSEFKILRDEEDAE